MLEQLSPRRPALLLLLTLVALAWLSLVVWGASPHSRYLDHENFGELSVSFSWGYGGTAALLVVSWTVMTTAMMLPTSLPLIQRFDLVTRRRATHPQLMALLLLGYLGVWMTFGVLALTGDLVVHRMIEQIAWIEQREWLVSASMLGLAGGYQFTSLKYHCLTECRSPLTFITTHWHGRHERLEALRLGVDHGIFCVGCCWTLMLLMFVVGIGNIGRMLLLGSVMAVEKNVSWGQRLSAPLGLGLLAITVSVVALNVA